MTKDLSPTQRKFAEIYASGRPAGRAYEEAGYNSKGNVAEAAATRLLRNVKVKELVEELRAESRSGAVKTATEVKEGLSRLLDTAEEKEDYTGFTQLANRLAKMEGHDEPEKHDHKHGFFTDIPNSNGLGRS